MNQAYSLWKLLGNVDSPKPLSDREPSWIRDIVCPKEAGHGGASSGHTIQIQFTRNDLMQENTRRVDLPRNLANCNGYLYCYKWTDKYMDYYQQPRHQQQPVEQ